MPIDQPKFTLEENRPAEVRYGSNRRTQGRQAPPPPVIKPFDSNTYASFKPIKVIELKHSKYRYLPIERMKLKGPQWWQTSDLPGQPPTGYNLSLHPKDDKETELSISSAGRPATNDSPFRDILEAPPHKLTDKEISSIECALNEAHTQTLNGKMIIVETGSFDQDGKQVYRIEFNHNPDGTEPFVPAEISFIAKPDKYKQYLAAVLASLKTIRWDKKAHLLP